MCECVYKFYKLIDLEIGLPNNPSKNPKSEKEGTESSHVWEIFQVLTTSKHVAMELRKTKREQSNTVDAPTRRFAINGGLGNFVILRWRRLNSLLEMPAEQLKDYYQNEKR